MPSWSGWGSLRFKKWFDVIDNKYFERVWPLQETALSQNTILLCGQATISLNAVRFAIMFMKPYWLQMTSLKRYGFGIPGQPEDSRRGHRSNVQGKDNSSAKEDDADYGFALRHAGYEAHEALRFVAGWGHVQDIWTDQSKWKYIEHLLRINCDLCATKLEDKIFSLYSIMSRIFEHYPKPIYDRPQNLLWVLTSLSIVYSFRTLDLIANVFNDGICPIHRSAFHCQSQECTDAESPRWCYQWQHEPTQEHWMRPFDFFNIALPVNTAWDRSPKVSYRGQSYGLLEAIKLLELVREDETAWPSSSENINLVVHGKMIARIQETTSRPEFLNSWIRARTGKAAWRRDDNFVRDMTISFQEWRKMVKRICSNDKAAQDMLYNLLMWERSQEVTSMDRKDFREWYDFLGSSLNDEHIPEDGDQPPEALTESDHHTQLCGHEEFRRLFVTTDGKVGKAIYAVEAGDLVVLPCWSRMPAILRPVISSDQPPDAPESESRSQYLLIGFAYIEGLMDCNDWNLQVKDIVAYSLI